jgi:ABC-2 type transport system permease protein
MAWNILLPVTLMFALSFAFSNDRAQFTIGLLPVNNTTDTKDHLFLNTRYVDFVTVTDLLEGERKVARHQIDLLIDFNPPTRYWINPDSAKGYLAEIALLQANEGNASLLQKTPITGNSARYVDWVLPGILGMNMMFSSLFGVGYVVVRYRKNGFLKRLRATPLRAIEFVVAQVASRIMLILIFTSLVFLGAKYFLDIRVDGSHLTLLVILFVGAISLVSLGLLVAARVSSEELAGGLLNMVTWPMMMMSGVWFSLESASDWVRQLAAIFPLTHILDATRAVMLDGATLIDIVPQLSILLVMSAVFMSIGALSFRWHQR